MEEKTKRENQNERELKIQIKDEEKRNGKTTGITPIERERRHGERERKKYRKITPQKIQLQEEEEK